jgi:hypothetical protein
MVQMRIAAVLQRAHAARLDMSDQPAVFLGIRRIIRASHQAWHGHHRFAELADDDGIGVHDGSLDRRESPAKVARLTKLSNNFAFDALFERATAQVV